MLRRAERTEKSVKIQLHLYRNARVTPAARAEIAANHDIGKTQTIGVLGRSIRRIKPAFRKDPMIVPALRIWRASQQPYFFHTSNTSFDLYIDQRLPTASTTS
jgi:hypothetical protein